MTAAQWLNEMNFPAEDQNLASSAVVYIKKGAGRSLKAGGQWIYDNEIDRVEAGERDTLGTGGDSLEGLRPDTPWALASSTPTPRSGSAC